MEECDLDKTKVAQPLVEFGVMYMFARITCNVPMRQMLTSLWSEAKDMQEMATGSSGGTKCQRRRQRHHRCALAYMPSSSTISIATVPTASSLA